MSKKRRRPPEWVIKGVLIPLVGKSWVAMTNYHPGHPNWYGWGEGVLGHLKELAGDIDTMASDAQSDSLPELKKCLVLLRRVEKRFAGAVEHAERRAEEYRAEMAA
jgi:hypothetical protein